MNFGCCLVFFAALITKFSAAFPQHDNQSNVETLVVNGYDKSAKSHSLLSDSNQIRNSPGIQDGNDVRLVKSGQLNLALEDLIFGICDMCGGGKVLEICYDCYEVDADSPNSCSSSQCYLKIYSDNHGIEVSNPKWQYPPPNPCRHYEFADSGRQGKPKIENGMIQLNIINYGCFAKAKYAKIKYPEIPTATEKSSKDSADATDDTASTSLWYTKWWFYVIIALFLFVFFIFILLFIGGAIILFCSAKNQNSHINPSGPLATTTAAATKSTAAAAGNTTQKTTEKNTAIEKSSIKKNGTTRTMKNDTVSSIKPSATLTGDLESKATLPGDMENKKMNLSHADKTMDGVESLAGNVTSEQHS